MYIDVGDFMNGINKQELLFKENVLLNEMNKTRINILDIDTLIIFFLMKFQKYLLKSNIKHSLDVRYNKHPNHFPKGHLQTLNC